MNTSTLSEKGWVVIPQDLRRRYGLKKGDRVHVIDYGGVILDRAGFGSSDQGLQGYAEGQDIVGQGAGPVEAARCPTGKIALRELYMSSCPIAYADCFAAALAQSMNAALVTGDPEFRKIKPDCNVLIEWLKPEE